MTQMMQCIVTVQGFTRLLPPPIQKLPMSYSSHHHPYNSRWYGKTVEGDYDDATPTSPINISQDGEEGSTTTTTAAAAEAEASVTVPSSSSWWKSQGRAFYKFTRPHTIRGTILACIAGTVRVLMDTPGVTIRYQWQVPRAVIGCLALLLGNVFIVGINQIYDQSIDKVNKPFLPVASGEMSTRTAWVAVITSAIVGPYLVHAFFPTLLFQLYSVGLGLGFLYSVPPFRTKRNPILAGLTIAIVRGFLLNFGVYYAVRDAIGANFAWSPKVTFIARFMTVFASIIAITKDLPDTEGDKAFQIETFATRIGVPRMAQGAVGLLLVNYVHAIVTGIRNPLAFRFGPMVGIHAALAAVLLVRFRQLDRQKYSTPAVKVFYKHIWDLFYLEYGLYTLI
jgi:homogentisate solanesyltransferase